MAHMNHKQAVELQLAVSYVLGELPVLQRDEYEDHYMDCPECARDVNAAAAFADTARKVFQQEARNEGPVQVRIQKQGGWFAWLRPVVAVPALAALLLIAGYQGFVSLPHWKSLATQSAAPRVLPMYSLIAANTRGGNSLTFHVRPGERFGLYLDVPADPTYTKYELRLEEPDGSAALLRTVSYAEAKKTVVVEITPGRRSGAYKIVVLGLTDQVADPARAPVLATIGFHIELST
jgi:hypothetical protein